MESMRRLIVAHLWWLVLLAALAMLLCHSLGVRQIAVDNTSLILLAVMMLSPFVASIKKVKIGEFEAEIQPDEVSRVARQAERSLPIKPAGDAPLRDTDEAASAIRSLADTDPVVALAKLRIEIETRLRRIESRVDPGAAKRNRPTPLASIIRKLVSQDVFEADLGESIRDVVSICNRAIHGEDIRDVDARQIIDTGAELLAVLDLAVRHYASNNPIETERITPQERDRLSTSIYRLTTIVPLVENPERHVYQMTQEELDDYFDGYSEFAEFVIGLERINELGEPPLAPPLLTVR
jgi:hypothetical protein